MLLEIRSLIKESDYFLNSKQIRKNDFLNYIKRCEELFIEIIRSNLKENIKINAYKGLEPVQNNSILEEYLIFRWFYRIMKYKTAIDDRKPYIVGNRETDRFKQRTDKIKVQLIAIKTKLNDPDLYLHYHITN